LIATDNLTVRRGGRASNIYRIPVEKISKYCEIFLSKSRNGLQESDAKARNRLRDSDPEIPQNAPGNPASHCERTLLLTHIDIKTSNVVPLDPHAELWQHVLDSLVERYGPDIVEAWMAKLSIIAIADGRCMLGAPTKFLANWISNHYQPALLIAFRTYDTSINDVEIKHRASTTALALPGASRDGS
jgi:hypothetical protein